uniref:Uncharacterized protein n=1 Tax=Moniliophthora roreri TaxID=221103 RepID=A0A0W0FYI3_MONRR
MSNIPTTSQFGSGTFSQGSNKYEIEIIHTGKHKPGKRDPFNGRLDSVLKPALKEYGEQLRKHKLHLEKGGSRHLDPDELNKWLDKKVKKLMQRDKFKNTMKDKSKPWEKCLRDKFKNWKNNVFIPDCRKTFIDHYAYIENEDEDSQTPNTSLRPSTAHTVLSALRDPAIAKGLVIKEHDTEIKEQTKALLTSEPSLKNNGGGAQACAITQLWAKADQESYQQRVAQETVTDVTKSEQTRVSYSNL